MFGENERISALFMPYLEEDEHILFCGGSDDMTDFSRDKKKALLKEAGQLLLGYAILASLLTYILYSLTGSVKAAAAADTLLFAVLAAGMVRYKSKRKSLFAVTDKNVIALKKTDVKKVKLTDVVDVVCNDITDKVGTVSVLYPDRNIVGEFVSRSPFSILEIDELENAEGLCKMIKEAVGSAKKKCGAD